MISIFLPIRKGSKRVINKNTRPIGKYKLGITELKILQIKKLKNLLQNSKNEFLKISEVVISTDCEKVKKFSKNFDWIKIHERPKHLATDDCLDELIEEVPKICNEKFILWTHVTSPYFNQNDYYDFLKKYNLKKKKTSSAFSADLVKKFLLNDKFEWISHNHKIKKWPRTQDLKKIFQINSAVFFSDVMNYIKLKDRLGKKALPIVSRKGSSLDIDDINDFNIVKKDFAEK